MASPQGPAGSFVPNPADVIRKSVLAEYGLPHSPAGGAKTESGAPAAVRQLEQLLRLATMATGLPFGVVNIITADEQHQIAAVGIDPGICARDDSMCAHVFLRGETTVIPDASEDPLFSDHPFVTGLLDSVRFYASIPLVTADDFALGSLCVFSDQPADLTADQVTMLEIIGAQVVEIFELEYSERRLRKALGDAELSNELLAAFAGRISHDLRNPLTSIIGFAELGDLRSGTDTEEFRIIERTSRRMLAMVDDVLDFSRIGGQLRRQPVSLAGLVQEIRDDLALSLSGARAEIQVNDFSLTADRDQLRTLLQNLILNAVNYCHPAVLPRVLVTAERDRDGVVVYVSDNGKGIPAEARGHVTEPLFRLHRDGDPAGSGLGLATSVRIAQAHGGRLEINSGPDGGTTVSVHFPASATV